MAVVDMAEGYGAPLQSATVAACKTPGPRGVGVGAGRRSIV
jgi:hypothetical protein